MLRTGETSKPDEALGLEGRDGVVGRLLGREDPGVEVGELLGERQGVVLRVLCHLLTHLIVWIEHGG